MSAAAGFQPAASSALVPLATMKQITGYGRSAAYQAMQAQLLPRPIKVGRASRWPEEELLALREAILRGDDEGARRALVRQLQARRGKPSLTLVRR
jgi:prophage regulatory protein